MGINRNVKNRAVFLDRDGVINQVILKNGRPHPPTSLKNLKIIPGVKEAISRLKEAGFIIIVVSNQPDVARGTLDRKNVEEINRWLGYKLLIDSFMICYHDDSDMCSCRKPRPGMLVSAAKQWQLDLTGSFMVGDRWKDISAGNAANCTTLFINYGYNEEQPESSDYIVGSLFEAANLILGEKNAQ